MKLPTCLLGYVHGLTKYETCGGGYLYQPKSFLFMEGPYQWGQESMYAVTHLQKLSKFGFLIMAHEKWWQLCFHIWYTFRYQQANSEGTWIPGSEIVFYWRIGYSRWDAGDCKYVLGEAVKFFGRLFKVSFGTWYGPGLHWD